MTHKVTKSTGTEKAKCSECDFETYRWDDATIHELEHGTDIPAILRRHEAISEQYDRLFAGLTNPSEPPLSVREIMLARVYIKDVKRLAEFEMSHLVEIQDLKDQKNNAYHERDQLVSALSKVYPSHLARDVYPDVEDSWRNIVCIHLPTGQATWHIHEIELEMFEHLHSGDAACYWDGHSTEEKYARLAETVPIYAEFVNDSD